MDRTFTNVIYLDKQTNRFALFFIIMFLAIPNIVLLFVLAVLFGKEMATNSSILLPTGVYTILNFTMIITIYFVMENNREKSIRTLDEGIVYNSVFKKFAVPWTSIYRVKVSSMNGIRPSVFVYTTKGRFYFTGMYVDMNEELPKIKPGFLRPKFYYPSGGEFSNKLSNNELYLIFKEKIPEKFI